MTKLLTIHLHTTKQAHIGLHIVQQVHKQQQHLTYSLFKQPLPCGSSGSIPLHIKCSKTERRIHVFPRATSFIVASHMVFIVDLGDARTTLSAGEPSRPALPISCQKDKIERGQQSSHQECPKLLNHFISTSIKF